VRALWIAFAVALVLGAGCGDDPAPTVAAATEPTPPTRAEFAREADLVCLEAASHFDELPEAVGGAKPVGLGSFMRDWVAELRDVEAPPAIAHHWTAGLDLLDQAADALDRAEAGDPEAQGEALWALEPAAQRHFNRMRVPFAACFRE